MLEQGRHPNYHLLNLVGYGLAKFGRQFVVSFGFKTKSSLYRYLVDLGVADTVGTVKNRQDLFDPFFDTDRKGWWQKGDAYIHRKQLIDAVFGLLDADDYAKTVQLFLIKEFADDRIEPTVISPIVQSRFKQLQLTGLEAELFFIQNFRQIERFQSGKVDDARLFGDGYDFQVGVDNGFYLVEVKGIRGRVGGVRMTENEYNKAEEFNAEYALVVVSELDSVPRLNAVFDPAKELQFEKSESKVVQVSYNCQSRNWY